MFATGELFPFQESRTPKPGGREVKDTLANAKNCENSGAGSSSAKGVLVSTRALREFEFDRENEVVTIGAGCIWSEYYEKMSQEAPEYSGKNSPYQRRLGLRKLKSHLQSWLRLHLSLASLVRFWRGVSV